MPLHLSFDYCCVIDIEEGRPTASYLRRLVALAQAGVISISVYGGYALENPPIGTRRAELPDFERRLAAVGLGPSEWHRGNHVCMVDATTGTHIYTPDVWTSYLWAVHQVLFDGTCPRIDFDFATYRRAWCEYHGLDAESLPTETEQHIARKWNNAKGDALGLAAHFSWGNDVFVTRDANFLAKAATLKRRGLVRGEILSPEDALAYVLNGSEATIPSDVALRSLMDNAG